MKTKSNKEMLKEAQYQENQKILDYWAGKDVIVAWVNRGEYQEAYVIGQHCTFESCRDFVIDRLVEDTDKACRDMGFVNNQEMFSWLFTNGDDDSSMLDLVENYYDGQDMRDY